MELILGMKRKKYRNAITYAVLGEFKVTSLVNHAKF